MRAGRGSPRDALVELVVLLLGDILLRTEPDCLLCVHLLPLINCLLCWCFFLLLLLLIIVIILRLNVVLLVIILVILIIVVVVVLIGLCLYLFFDLHINWELDELRVLLRCILQLVL